MVFAKRSPNNGNNYDFAIQSPTFFYALNATHSDNLKQLRAELSLLPRHRTLPTPPAPANALNATAVVSAVRTVRWRSPKDPPAAAARTEVQLNV